MSLTDKAIKSFKPQNKQYKKSDSKGLFMLIHTNGSKYWRLKYRFNGKEKTMALGVYPEVSLKEARDKTMEARKLLEENIDPAHQKKLEKLTSEYNSENTFEGVAREWHENQKNVWCEGHFKRVLSRLEADIFPAIGFRPINLITAPELLSALRVIEDRDAFDVANRARQTCGQIFRYAISTGRAERDISVDLKGALKTRKKEHHKFLSAKELPEFLERLEKYDGELQTKLGLKLIILTMLRTNELREAKWEEIDLENKQWKIPAEKMKARRIHIVPLSKQAIDIIKQLKELNSYSEYVFPNRNNPKECMSENTLLYALYRLGYHSRATVHGFRATASTILNEHGFNRDYVELQLAHEEKNNVRASYNHAEYLPQRTSMMQWWADYLDGKKADADNVINIAGVA